MTPMVFCWVEKETLLRMSQNNPSSIPENNFIVFKFPFRRRKEKREYKVNVSFFNPLVIQIPNSKC